MTLKNLVWTVSCLSVLVLWNQSASAQVLYSQAFEADATASWLMSGGPVDEPGTNNTDGDNRAFFHFDYSTIGIPKAPHSAAGDGTFGMKLQTNLDANFDGISTSATVTGMSASPVGLDIRNLDGTFPDFKMSFDAWSNFTLGTSAGATNLATAGFGTAGNFANYPGHADGLWFGATGDGGSSVDYRIYSQERSISYQLPYLNPTTDIDGMGNPIDSHANYLAGSRNNTGGTLYTNTFPSVSAPAGQVGLFTAPDDQSGTTAAGAFGMAWHYVEIKNVGHTVTWTVDGVALATVDTTNLVTPFAGGNILFGASDINQSASQAVHKFELLFQLFDNIKVEKITSVAGDYNLDGKVDAGDYVLWRDNPASHGGTPAGYDAWRANFGTGPGSGSSLAGAAVPEPATLTLIIGGVFAVSLARRRD